MSRWVLSISALFALLGFSACASEAERDARSFEGDLRRELDRLVLPPTCPRFEGNRESFVEEQLERSRIEVLRFQVDARAPYRAARAASLALACSDTSAREYIATRQFAKRRWEAFVAEGHLRLYRKHLADRSADSAAQARALSELARLLDEASPELASRLRSKGRRASAF